MIHYQAVGAFFLGVVLLLVKDKHNKSELE